MKRKLLVVLLSIAILATGSAFFAVSANAEACRATKVELGSPSPGVYKRVGNSGNWRIAHLWTNHPGYNQSLRKVALSPRDNIEAIVGGDYWVFPKSCAQKTVVDQYLKDSTPISWTTTEMAQIGLVKHAEPQAVSS